MSSLKAYNAKLKGRRCLADIFERIVMRYRIPATSNSEFRAAGSVDPAAGFSRGDRPRRIYQDGADDPRIAPGVAGRFLVMKARPTYVFQI